MSEIVSPLASLRESDSPICAFGCRLNFIFGNAALEPWLLAMSVAVPHLLVLLIPAPLSVSALAILLLSTRFRLARISLGHCGNGSQRRAHFDRPMSDAVSGFPRAAAFQTSALSRQCLAAALSRDSLFINFLNTNNYEKEHFYESDDGGHGSHNVHDIHSLWR